MCISTDRHLKIQELPLSFQWKLSLSGAYSPLIIKKYKIKYIFFSVVKCCYWNNSPNKIPFRHMCIHVHLIFSFSSELAKRHYHNWYFKSENLVCSHLNYCIKLIIGNRTLSYWCQKKFLQLEGICNISLVSYCALFYN